jgi:thiamine biosynthesis lipoprotein
MTAAITTDVRMIMGLPFSLHLGTDIETPAQSTIEAMWAELARYDRIFSTYRPDSQVLRHFRGELDLNRCDPTVSEVFALAHTARGRTDGVFDINGPDGPDPSGIVKGWATQTAFARAGIGHGYLNAGGDIVLSGPDRCWRIGIEHPADPRGLLTVVEIGSGAIATSGRAHRGNHLWDPRTKRLSDTPWQATVIGPDLVWADILATAAAVAGRELFRTIDWPDSYHALLCDQQGVAYATPGLPHYFAIDIAPLALCSL